jgi:UDP-2,3-diacylglucosamine hydrolase
LDDRVLFLSDVHLTPLEPEKSKRFIDFLDREAGKAAELYILGDLFDFWVGPKHLKLREHAEVLVALRKITASGTRVYFIHGNRDFHVCKSFAADTGIKVLGDSAHIVIGGKRVLLTHGDLLMANDRMYQLYRTAAHLFFVKAFYRHLPVGISYGFAMSLRRRSQSANKFKSKSARSISSNSAIRFFKKGCDVIICGHVHRPSQTSFTVDGSERLLCTLGDWDRKSNYAVWQDGAVKLM